MRILARNAAFILLATVYAQDTYTTDTTPRSMNSARTYCRNLGGDIATVENNAQRNALQSHAKSTLSGVAPDAQGRKTIWLGLTDTAVEGTYVWQDGSGGTSFFWDSGQPSGGSPDCAAQYVVLNADDTNATITNPTLTKGKWHNVQCSSTRYTVCGFTQPKNFNTGGVVASLDHPVLVTMTGTGSLDL